MANDFNKWEKEMKDWLDAIIEWQKNNPDKDWLDELCANDGEVESAGDDSGGDRPPTPPKNPE